MLLYKLLAYIYIYIQLSVWFLMLVFILFLNQWNKTNRPALQFLLCICILFQVVNMNIYCILPAERTSLYLKQTYIWDMHL